MLRLNNQIKLGDGRKLGYAECGAARGRPLFLFHGSPGSRLTVSRKGALAETLGVRILAPDRPGYGLSDQKPDRTLLGWAEDVQTLADQLGIERFAVLGKSAGAPHAAACAVQLGPRVNLAVLTSSPAPPELPGADDHFSFFQEAAFSLAKYAPNLAKATSSLAADLLEWKPETFLTAIGWRLSEADRRLLRNEEVRQGLLSRYREAFRQGGAGYARDVKLIGQAWGFDLAELSCPVHLWHGQEDEFMPPRLAKILHQVIPHSVLRLFPETGHLMLDVDQIWRALLQLVTAAKGSGCAA